MLIDEASMANAQLLDPHTQRRPPAEESTMYGAVLLDTAPRRSELLASRSPRSRLSPPAGRRLCANVDRTTFHTRVTRDDLDRHRDLSTCQASRAPPRDEPGRSRADFKPAMRTAHWLTHSVPRSLVSRLALKIGIRRPVHRVTLSQPAPRTGPEGSTHAALAGTEMVKEASSQLTATSLPLSESRDLCSSRETCICE